MAFPAEFIGGLRAGKLDTLLVLQQRTDVVDDAMAMRQPQWTETARMWGRVEQIPLKRRGEDIIGQQIMAIFMYHVMIRTPIPPMSERDRLLMDGDEARPLNILNIVFPDNGRTHALLICESGLVDG